jgi:hypothetical protein
VFEISDLPVHYGFREYEEKVLVPLVAAGRLAWFRGFSTPARPCFRACLAPEHAGASEAELAGDDWFSLRFTEHLYLNFADPRTGHVVRYESLDDVMRAFCAHRMPYYERRHALLVSAAERSERVARNKARLIRETRSGDLRLAVGQAELERRLAERGYDRDGGGGDGDGGGGAAGGSLDYLLEVPLRWMTDERAAQLEEKAAAAALEMRRVRAVAPEDLWAEDLRAFVAAYSDHCRAMAEQEPKPRAEDGPPLQTLVARQPAAAQPKTRRAPGAAEGRAAQEARGKKPAAGAAECRASPDAPTKGPGEKAGGRAAPAAPRKRPAADAPEGQPAAPPQKRSKPASASPQSVGQTPTIGEPK